MKFLSFKNVILIIIICLFFWGGWFVLKIQQDQVISTVTINQTTINVELAQTLKEKIQGLSGRDILDENQGMLFIYDVQDLYSFWMKDMKFPLDIIWIDKDYTIIDLHTNVLPGSFPQRFQPKNPAQYILEVNAGFCEKHNITVGDIVSILF